MRKSSHSVVYKSAPAHSHHSTGGASQNRPAPNPVSVVQDCLFHLLELWKRSLLATAVTHFTFDTLWDAVAPHIGETIGKLTLRMHAEAIFAQQSMSRIYMLPKPHMMELAQFFNSPPYRVTNLTAVDIVFIESVLQSVIVEITDQVLYEAATGAASCTVTDSKSNSALMLRRDLNEVLPFSTEPEHMRAFTKQDDKFLLLAGSRVLPMHSKQSRRQ